MVAWHRKQLEIPSDLLRTNCNQARYRECVVPVRPNRSVLLTSKLLQLGAVRSTLRWMVRTPQTNLSLAQLRGYRVPARERNTLEELM